MHSENDPLGQIGWKLAERQHEWERMRLELAQWEKDNAKLAADWKEALSIEDEKKNEREAFSQFRRVMDEMEDHLVRMGVPLRLAEIVARPPMRLSTPSLEAVRRAVEGKRNFVLLLGAAGAGKSVAAAWAMWDYAKPREPCLEENTYGYKAWTHPTVRTKGAFWTAAEISRMSAYDKDDQQDFRKACFTKALVLDDLGTERISDTWLAMLDELIDARYGSKLFTVITSNLDVEAFKARYGERICDRIRHDGVIAGAGAESLRKTRP